MTAALLLAVLAAGCGEDPGRSQDRPVDLSQVDYVQQLRADQQALDRGQLLHTAPGRVNTGDDLVFDVTITDLGKGSPLAKPAPVPDGQVASPEAVPTGGDVGIRLTCEGVACTAYDAARKPVAGPGQSAVWSFGVHAGGAGAARIHIAVVAYRANTEEVLSSAAPITVAFTVRPTWTYVLSQALRWLFTTAPGLGLFSGSAVLTTVGGWLGRARARRRKPDVVRVLAAIPRGERADRLLFGLLHVTGRPVREVAALTVDQLRRERRAVLITFQAMADGTYTARITDRELRGLLRRLAATAPGGRLFGEGPDTSTNEVARRWRAHCARIGLDLPLAALQSGPGRHPSRGRHPS